jgi:ankyrin repeat protein
MGASCSHLDSGNPYDRGTSLVQAVLSQEWENVKEMLDSLGASNKKIDINVTEKELGGTALIWAAALKHEATVTKLLALNADPNIQTNDGRTCLFTVSEHTLIRIHDVILVIRIVCAVRNFV